jgi:hypothetical protein
VADIAGVENPESEKMKNIPAADFASLYRVSACSYPELLTFSTTAKHRLCSNSVAYM